MFVKATWGWEAGDVTVGPDLSSLISATSKGSLFLREVAAGSDMPGTGEWCTAESRAALMPEGLELRGHCIRTQAGTQASPPVQGEREGEGRAARCRATQSQGNLPRGKSGRARFLVCFSSLSRFSLFSFYDIDIPQFI